MDDLAEIDPPFVVDTLPEGTYVVGWHNGPYSRIAETTREIIAWGDDQRVAWDTEPDAAGDRWASWFELYLTEPSFGPEGPMGSVEICVGICDEARPELRSD
jgi:predicted transcriptional regulator YdeE